MQLSYGYTKGKHHIRLQLLGPERSFFPGKGATEIPPAKSDVESACSEEVQENCTCSEEDRSELDSEDGMYYTCILHFHFDIMTDTLPAAKRQRSGNMKASTPKLITTTSARKATHATRNRVSMQDK